MRDYHPSNSPHDIVDHVDHMLGTKALAPGQTQYGGYAFVSDKEIVTRSTITALRPVIEQAITQVLGSRTVEQAAQLYGGDDTLDGRAGTCNEAHFSGSTSDYAVTRNADSTVTLASETYGTDTLSNIHGVVFYADDAWYSMDELVA